MPPVQTPDPSSDCMLDMSYIECICLGANINYLIQTTISVQFGQRGCGHLSPKLMGGKSVNQTSQCLISDIIETQNNIIIGGLNNYLYILNHRKK